MIIGELSLSELNENFTFIFRWSFALSSHFNLFADFFMNLLRPKITHLSCMLTKTHHHMSSPGDCGVLTIREKYTIIQLLLRVCCAHCCVAMTYTRRKTRTGTCKERWEINYILNLLIAIILSGSLYLYHLNISILFLFPVNCTFLYFSPWKVVFIGLLLFLLSVFHIINSYFIIPYTLSRPGFLCVICYWH